MNKRKHTRKWLALVTATLLLQISIGSPYVQAQYLARESNINRQPGAATSLSNKREIAASSDHASNASVWASLSNDGEIAAAPSDFINGGFETGDFTGWTIDASAITPTVGTSHPHSGTHSALIGKAAPINSSGDSAISQPLNVTAQGTKLIFWYWGVSNGCAQTWQDAYVTDANGTILATIMHVNQNATAWQRVLFDLTPYAGQTVRLKFLVHNNNMQFCYTGMYVDDASYFDCPCWQSGTPLPRAQLGAAVANLGGYIYNAGGDTNATVAITEVLRFDGST